MFISSLTMSYDMYFSSFSHAWTVSLSSVLTFKFKFPSSSEWPLIARPYLKRKRNEVICFKRPARRLACRFASWDEIMTSTPWAVFLKDNFITAALWASDASCFLNFSNDFFQLLKPHVVKASSPYLLKFRRHFLLASLQAWQKALLRVEHTVIHGKYAAPPFLKCAVLVFCFEVLFLKWFLLG